ncbi:hypothetical protein [Paraburkholderia aspalathi]|nr:hypothetical protein [Paraburkholderia aspalathi]
MLRHYSHIIADEWDHISTHTFEAVLKTVSPQYARRLATAQRDVTASNP